MKCVCGYEGEKERFIKIIMDCEHRFSDIHFFKVCFPNKTFGQSRMYACPECGTLKIEVKE